MKTIISILSLILLFQSLQAQDTVSSPALLKYKFSFSYGIYAINPSEINDHISTSNDVFGSTTRTIRSIPEIAVTFSVRPLQDEKIFLLRVGSLSIQRSYQVSIPETQNTPITTGYTTGAIKELYTAFPLSIGGGFASSTFDSQMQLEIVYGLGYIKEEASYTSSTGKVTSYAKSFFSPAYGFRIAGQTTIRFSNKIGITLELGYRVLSFDEYQDDTSAQPANIKFSYSGLNGSAGLSIIF
jgi:hypothetical protein